MNPTQTRNLNKIRNIFKQWIIMSQLTRIRISNWNVLLVDEDQSGDTGRLGHCSSPLRFSHHSSKSNTQLNERENIRRNFEVTNMKKKKTHSISSRSPIILKYILIKTGTTAIRLSCLSVQCRQRPCLAQLYQNPQAHNHVRNFIIANPSSFPFDRYSYLYPTY